MKRLTVLFLIFLSVTLNMIGWKSVFAITNTFTQGIYKSSDLIPSKSNAYVFSNISSTDGVFLIILDENQVINQAIRLQPNSQKHVTVSILPDYRVVIIGNGEVYFEPNES